MTEKADNPSVRSADRSSESSPEHQSRNNPRNAFAMQTDRRPNQIHHSDLLPDESVTPVLQGFAKGNPEVTCSTRWTHASEMQWQIDIN
ncbi:hypothetical protein FOMG_17946 [Fusarium oxysporum f. sp. melonis 26406]|uniref:Uncharacterized protein n=1 Tax=Fusarium oxysporum f. sp. melonis 26406 TaxID=1089452 RepID=W9ZWF9_FUSOX|nr:hypothetical protein FOMG_17946 [Fusarium oxysporum f. sp. melonis 26406]